MADQYSVNKNLRKIYKQRSKEQKLRKERGKKETLPY